MARVASDQEKTARTHLGGNLEAHTFALTLVREEGFRYRVDFDDPTLPPLWLDEPPPLGEGSAPNAVRLLGAAIGNCLAASLQFCLGRAHLEVEDVTVRVEGNLVRNPEGRLRVGELHVLLEPVVQGEACARFDRCVELFEEFCLVTESVRRGIDVLVEVRPRHVPAAEESLAAAALD